MEGRDVATDSHAVEDASVKAPVLVAAVRVGAVVLLADKRPGSETFRAILKALNDDPRVSAVTATDDPPSDHLINAWIRFPIYRFLDGEAALDVADDTPVDGMLMPRIWFDVDVPIKNQPEQYGQEPTSAHYHAVWNGAGLVVTWEAPEDGGRHQQAGGQVVAEILRTAARAVGLDVCVQACTPLCENVFTHTHGIMVVRDLPDQVLTVGKRRDYDDSVLIEVPGLSTDNSLQAHSRALFSEVGLALGRYGRMKNLGVRLQQLRDDADATAEALLDQIRTHNRSSYGWRIWKGWFATREHRKLARLFIDDLWLEAAMLERMHGDWRRLRAEFEGEVTPYGFDQLFLHDYEHEATQIEQLDAQRYREAAQHAGQYFDNRAMMLATSLGAIAGGAVGGAVALLSAL